MEKIEDYVKLIYEITGLQGKKEKYKKLLEMLKDDSSIEKLCAYIIEHPKSEELTKFLLAFINNKNYENVVLSNKIKDEDLSRQIEDDLNALLNELLEGIEIDDELVYKSKKALHLTNCELKVYKSADGFEVKYIEAARMPFDEIKEDFEYAKHLTDIYELIKNEEVPERLLIICSNKNTALLACKYISALIDTSNSGPFSEEDGFTFEDKIPVLSVEEILPQLPGFLGAFSYSPYSYLYLKDQNTNQPWWFQPEAKELPLIILVGRNTSLPIDFPEKLKIFDSHPYIFVVYEKKEGFNWQETKFDYEMNNDIVLNDTCFKCNFETALISEPDVDEEYYQKVLESVVKKEGYSLAKEVDKKEILEKLKNFCRGNFEGNPSVCNLVKNAIKRKKDDSRILTKEDFWFLERNFLNSKIEVKDHKDLAKKSAYERLNTEIYGLEEQKQKILQAVNLLKLRKARQKAGLRPPNVAPIFLFYGPPGTGKTRFAEIMGEIFCEEELLPGNRMIAGSAVTLCKGKYVGHSAPQTRELFENHDIIFLDEIYSMAAENNGSIDTFSQEILAELCIQLENVSKNCDKLVILAGYGGNVLEEHNFVHDWLRKNPGIASRITFFVQFYPYSPEDEMPKIFETLAKNLDIELEEGWEEIVIQFFKERYKCDDFGNGREARRLLDNCLLIQAQRINPDTADLKSLKLLICEDIKRAAIEILKGNSGIKKVKKSQIGFFKS